MFIELTRPLVYALGASLWITVCVVLFRRLQREPSAGFSVLAIACLLTSVAMLLWLPISLQADWHAIRLPSTMNRILYIINGFCFILEVVLYPCAYLLLVREYSTRPSSPNERPRS